MIRLINYECSIIKYEKKVTTNARIDTVGRSGRLKGSWLIKKELPARNYSGKSNETKR